MGHSTVASLLSGVWVGFGGGGGRVEIRKPSKLNWSEEEDLACSFSVFPFILAL